MGERSGFVTFARVWMGGGLEGVRGAGGVPEVMQVQFPGRPH